MNVFFIWLYIMNDDYGQHIVTAFAEESICRHLADEMNAAVGPHRNLHWECQKQAVER
jgi:hypothetical protein